MDIQNFDKAIIQLREKLGISQEELASRLGVAFTTVNRWENGRSAPRGKAKRAVLALIEQEGLADATETVAGKRPLKAVKKDVLSTKSMEQMLWSAACSVRGEKDAPKFKDYILPLVFIKRLSDVFDDETVRLAEEYGDEELALTMIDDDHYRSEGDVKMVRFYIPAEARWDVVSGRKTFEWPEGREPKSLGEQLTMTVRAIVRENKKLAGVIDLVDYNETRNGEREISDQALSGIIESLSDSRYRLGLYDVEPDFLGRAYEYLLRKFAEGQGQSAGEFFTPKEVGWLMAYMMLPRQGEEVYDYACGSAGLLVKCELALEERERKVGKPLQLYGQELTGATFAIAWMNMVIHDMEGQIVRGNSMTNPKFRDDAGRLKKFDIVVANPMWNQPFESKTYEDDPFDRFESQGGFTSGKADWAWLQHTLACLKTEGRAAVVLDTGAVTRGSGSRNDDREKMVRKWFVDRDLIEAVILLPDNLFYNTTAAGIIITLNKNKMPKRKGKIVLVNASKEFKKGRPKNYLPDNAIQKIAKACLKGDDVERFVKVIDLKTAEENDYNLSPAKYIDTSEAAVYREIPELLEELNGLKKEETAVDKELAGIFEQMEVGK